MQFIGICLLDAISQANALSNMLKEKEHQFDPALLSGFKTSQDIWKEGGMRESNGRKTNLLLSWTGFCFEEFRQRIVTPDRSDRNSYSFGDRASMYPNSMAFTNASVDGSCRRLQL
jgi:hypothetical protein